MADPIEEEKQTARIPGGYMPRIQTTLGIRRTYKLLSFKQHGGWHASTHSTYFRPKLCFNNFFFLFIPISVCVCK